MLDLPQLQAMREPWRGRRTRLEGLVTGATLPNMAVVSTAEDVVGLWDLWVRQGGGDGVVHWLLTGQP